MKVGYPPTERVIRRLAYTFAEINNVAHRFNKELEVAGYDWRKLFMRRHPQLSIRKDKSMSTARGMGMCLEEVNDYFILLQTVNQDTSIVNRPAKIYNIDESGLQLNNTLQKVIATKGARDVHRVTSAEKGETIRVNAEGKFLPPCCVFKKRKRKRDEFERGMPPGSRVVMGEKPAHVNMDLFMGWMRDHIVPRKDNGKVLLILDGHSSLCSDVAVFDYAHANDIVLLCLPQSFNPLNTY